MTAPQAAPGVHKVRHRTALIVAILVAIVVLTVGGWYYLLYSWQSGPAQPIAFSHRFHVSGKKVSCFMCHAEAVNSGRAGVPSLQTCMHCHSRIISHHPEIAKLRGSYDRGQPVEWVRINDLPDHAYFDHSIHLHRGIDCGGCHGNVAGMDRVKLERSFKMGFCVQCHRDNGATRDCLACHR